MQISGGNLDILNIPETYIFYQNKMYRIITDHIPLLLLIYLVTEISV